MDAKDAVYVLDDNADTLESLSLLLQLSGLTTICGTSARDAVGDICAAKPAVALIDLSMPDRDGFSVARDVRADPSVADTVLIAHSAFVDRETREACRAAGFDYFLMKPSDPEALLACIRQEPLDNLSKECIASIRPLSARAQQHEPGLAELAR
jgi:CheY-like chemotaxis protein